jgi:hypothetical protein
LRRYAILVREIIVYKVRFPSIAMIHTMGGDAMKKNKKKFSFNELIGFGLFILALLTFVFMFYK